MESTVSIVLITNLQECTTDIVAVFSTFTKAKRYAKKHYETDGWTYDGCLRWRSPEEDEDEELEVTIENWKVQ